MLEGLPARRSVLAATVALGVLALVLLVLLRAPLASLPAYPAVVTAFLLIVVLPGLVLARAVVREHGSDPLALVGFAPALGLALMAIPGLIALEAHLSLDDFALLYAFVAAAACGVATFLSTGGGREPAATAEPSNGGWLVAAMLAVVLGGVATTPYWAGDRIAGDFDDWTYMAYVREYLDTERLNAEEPFIGSGEPVSARMRSNVWVLSQALVADAADVSPYDLLFEYLPPILAVFAALAVYTFASALFGNRTVALLATGFLLGYAFLDLAPQEGMGRNLFLRISEDKMVAGFVLMPLALSFVARYARRPSTASLAGLSLAGIALLVVHPVPLAFVAAAIVALAALRLGLDRDTAGARRLAALLVPLALTSIWPFVLRQLLAGDVPEVFESASRFREEYHFVRLGAGLVMGNYHLILHPLMIAAIAVAPLVWLAARRSPGHQLVLAMSGCAVLLFFVPLFATAVSEVMAPQTLMRVPWLVPVAPVLAYGAYCPATRIAGPRFVLGLAPAAVLVLALAVALGVQEQYGQADDGDFYDSVSETALLPGSERSIFLGGIDRAFSGAWRLEPHEEELFAYMEASFARGSVVLMDVHTTMLKMPGMLTDIYPVDPFNRLGEGQRRLDSTAFAEGRLTFEELDVITNRYGVDYIIVREVEAANNSLRDYPGVRFMAEVSPYVVYQVRG
jgi:hypothetical protein